MKKHTGTWKGLMLHHTATASTKTVSDIRAMHKGKGWSDVGYHYLMQKSNDGHYYLKSGRSTSYQGAHCDVGDYNNTYIGLSIIGNFETSDKLTDIQYNDLVDAIVHIMKKFNLKSFKGHREAKATACPGKNINLNQLRKDISKKIGFTVSA